MIVNHNDKSGVVVAFHYRGYEISISTRGTYAELEIFQEGDTPFGELTSKLRYGSAENIRRAMAIIDVVEGPLEQ